MALAIQALSGDSISTAMKPPLYRPPLQRSVSSQDSSVSQDQTHSFHRSASLDTPGIFNRPSSPEIQEQAYTNNNNTNTNTNNDDIRNRSSNSASPSLSSSTSTTTDSFSASLNTEASNAGIKPPPPLPSFLLAKPSSSAAHSTCCCKTNLGVCVPKHTVETWDRLFVEGLNADVCIFTEDGGMTAAHSFVLAASSPVFKRLLDEQKPGKIHRRRSIHILGVPYDAGRVFTRFIYSSRYEKQEMEKYVLHLLVLSHVYSIPVLKKTCSQELERGLLTTDNVIDVLNLARLCDEPRLNLLCLRLIVSDFKTVVRSEGWRVMRECDQSLEQELVGQVIEADAKKQERSRKREEDRVYKQLHDAMEALVHICRDGCRTIGPPQDGRTSDEAQRSCGFPACKGLEALVRHFAACRTKVSGGCLHCKRMWQLLELHSRMCSGGDADSCKVPLCRHFKDRIGQQTKKEEARWKLLVSKVSAARGASTGFSLAAVSATLEQQELL